MGPQLRELKRMGQYRGRTDLVFSQLDRGGVGRFLLDPSWHSDEAERQRNVRLYAAWVPGRGPSFVWETTRAIKRGA